MYVVQKMAPPPVLQLGEYVITRNDGTTARCKAYDAPCPFGIYICTIDPGTMLGPIEEVLDVGDYVTILVRGYYINVWAASNQYSFAFKVPSSTMSWYRSLGWQDE